MKKRLSKNSIQPRFIDPNMKPFNGAYIDVFNATVAFGHNGRPQEAVAGIVFITSPAAPYITGVVLNFDTETLS